MRVALIFLAALVLLGLIRRVLGWREFYHANYDSAPRARRGKANLPGRMNWEE
jgi:deoxyribodipyrimidine photolyase-like uncharacterized protein